MSLREVRGAVFAQSLKSCELNVEKIHLNLSIDLFTRVSINTDTNVCIDAIDSLDRSAHPYSILDILWFWFREA